MSFAERIKGKGVPLLHPQSKGEGLLDSSRENVSSSSSFWRTNSQQPGPPASACEKGRWQSWAGRQSSSCAPTVTLAGTPGLADCSGHPQNQAYLTSLASHQEALRCSCLPPPSSCGLCQGTCQRKYARGAGHGARQQIHTRPCGP